MQDATTISITYSQEPHPSCQAGKELPPFWFASAMIDGIERHLYIGSKFRPVRLEEFLHPQPKTSQASHQQDISTEPTPPLSDAVGQQDSTCFLQFNKNSLEYKQSVHTTFAEKTKASVAQKHPSLSPSTVPPEIPTLEPSIKLPSEKEFRQDIRRFKTLRYKDVKPEYRQLIKKYHPDQFGGQDDRVQEWMKIINMVHENHIRRMQRLSR